MQAQTFSGSGDTLPAMIFELGHTWVVMIPLAYFLQHFNNLGVYGIRWGVVCGVYAGAAAYFIYFLTGRWKNKKI